MSRGLKALDEIIESFYDKELEEIKIVKKELSALAIIIKKGVSLLAFTVPDMSLSIYNNWWANEYGVQKLTRKEFNLIKEIYENEQTITK